MVKNVPRASRVILAAGLVVLLIAGMYLMNSHGCSKDGGGTDSPMIIGLTIYFTDASKSDSLSDADLIHVDHEMVAPDTVRKVFGYFSRRDPPVVFKGPRLLGVAQYADGTKHRLALSRTGGSFGMIDTGEWYIVGEETRASYNVMIMELPGKVGDGTDRSVP